MSSTGPPRRGLNGLTVHALRHTAASLMIAEGATVKAVQTQLGHRSATTTLDRYAHLFGDELGALAGRLDAAVAKLPTDPRRTQHGPTPIGDRRATR